MLCELGERLLACADAALLDTPLDALGEQVDSDEARELLTSIHAAGEADNLRELLGESRLGRWQNEVATEREAHALSAQLRRWLGDGPRGADDPARLATVPPLPADLEGILSWARPYELLGELTRPAAEVLAEHARGLGNRSLIECCLGAGSHDAPAGSALDRDPSERLARAYLVQQASAHAALAARARLWARPLPEGPLRLLCERLRAVLGAMPLHALHSVLFVPARPVQLGARSGCVRAQLRDANGRSSFCAQLWLSGYERRALHAHCEGCSRAHCLHVQALAGRLLDACLEPSDRLHAELSSFARVPSWQRFLRALEVDAAPAVEGGERLGFRVRVEGERVALGFRVRVEGERVAVAVVLQRLENGGRFAPGKLASARRVLRGQACAPRDLPVLDAMLTLHRSLGAQFVNADLGLLRALCEHPFVQLEGCEDALQVAEQSVEVALQQQADGLLPRVSLGGAELPPGARPREASFLLHCDPSAGQLVFAPLTPALRRLLAALQDFHGVLPEESYPQLAPWLASLQHVARVSAPNALRGTERTPSRKLLLRVTPGLDEGIDVALSLRALPLGALWPPGQGPELVYGLSDGVHVYARRDLAWEREAAQQLSSMLTLQQHARLEPFAYRIEGRQAALELLAQVARLSDRVEIEWAERARKLSLESSVRSADLSIRFFQKGQWLQLEGGARSAAGEIAIGRLLQAARQGERFVQVRGDDYVEIERELFERLEQAQLCVSGSVREPVCSTAATHYMLQALGPPCAAGDATTRAYLARARERPQDAPAALPEAWQQRLRGYQIDGVRWMIERSRWAPGVCLADEMGLGKTVQTIALLEARAALGPALVVAPTSVTGNWLHELARFAPSLRVQSWHGLGRAERPIVAEPGCVVVVSYDVLLRDRERFAQLAIATQVIDEAQAVKNAHTHRAQAVAQVPAEFRVALSGTPVENRLGDLWSLFQLIAPGLLGSWSRFRSRFAVPIERYAKSDRAEALRALVGPLLLRRTKQQVASELPSRTEVVQRIELSRAEQDLYDTALRHARRALGKRRLDDAASYHVQILAELTRLRQLACHPRLVVEDERVESTKLAALLSLLEDVVPRGHRVLVFSQFTRHLALVREALDKTVMAYLYLDGSTPAAQRTALVARFQQGDAPLMLISLKAGGTGLNLTAADYVVHLDPWWNPAAEDQASDRAHRIGQQRPLTIVKLVAQNTIEEHVLGLHGHKRRLAQSVLDGTAVGTSFDTDALEALLGAVEHRTN